MISPRARRAFHDALDLVLDAMNEDARHEPKRRTRDARPPTPEELAAISPETKRKAEDAIARAEERRRR